MSRRFVVVTQDLSGLGWTKILQEEGEQVLLLKGSGASDEEEAEQYWRVGQGMVDQSALFTERGEVNNGLLESLHGPETHWLFDRNCYADVADGLRADGQKVFGTTALSSRMENDRAYGVSIANSCGLESPPTYEFSTIDEGVAFIEEHPTTAYVLKPNASDNNYSTFVPFREDPEDANYELLCYLRNCQEMEKGYILQERKPGVEVNVEVWLERGVPFFAFCCLENKRRWNHDLGEMSGCAGDIAFVLPLESPIIARTIGKMLPFYTQRGYTGFADCNVIIGDKHIWFLEVCNRFGYSSHPNLFINCALDGFGNIMSDWMHGRVETIASRFRDGFGASITCFIDHSRSGLPVHVNPREVRNFYPFDGFRMGEDVLLTGYSNEVGIFMDHDYTIEEAAEGCLTKLLHNEAVSFPDMAYRTDLHKTDYKGAPIKRYSALRSMRLV